MLNNPVLKVVQFWVTEYCIETLYSAGHLLLIVGLLHKNNSNIRHFEVTFNDMTTDIMEMLIRYVFEETGEGRKFVPYLSRFQNFDNVKHLKRGSR